MSLHEISEASIMSHHFFPGKSFAGFDLGLFSTLPISRTPVYCDPLFQDETHKNTGYFSNLCTSFPVPVLLCWVGGRCAILGATLNPKLLSYTLGAWVCEIVCLHTPNPPTEPNSWSCPLDMLRR